MIQLFIYVTKLCCEIHKIVLQSLHCYYIIINMEEGFYYLWRGGIAIG